MSGIGKLRQGIYQLLKVKNLLQPVFVTSVQLKSMPWFLSKNLESIGQWMEIRTVFFFHGIIRGWLKRKAIKGLLMNGEWIEDPTKLKEIYGFYKRHFSESCARRTSFSSDKFRKLNEGQFSVLESPFLEAEIKQAI